MNIENNSLQSTLPRNVPKIISVKPPLTELSKSLSRSDEYKNWHLLQLARFSDRSRLELISSSSQSINSPQFNLSYSTSNVCLSRPMRLPTNRRSLSSLQRHFVLKLPQPWPNDRLQNNNKSSQVKSGK